VASVWHVLEGSPTGLQPGFYCEDEETLAALLADPTTEHASVEAGEPAPFLHGQRARIATPEQAEVLRANESKARLYAGMTADQIARYEDWVRRYKAERAVEDAKAIAVEAERRVELGTMDDIQVVNESLYRAGPGAWDYEPETALKILQDAGFVRAHVLAEALVHVERAIADFRVISMQPLYGAPRLSSDLQRVRDLLAGEAKGQPWEAVHSRVCAELGIPCQPVEAKRA